MCSEMEKKISNYETGLHKYKSKLADSSKYTFPKMNNRDPHNESSAVI